MKVIATRVAASVSILALAVAGASCAAAGEDGPAPAAEEEGQLVHVAWNGVAFHKYVEPALRVSFDIPAFAFNTRTESFPVDQAVTKSRHLVEVAAGKTVEARVEVWDNPEQLDADGWLHRTVAFLLDGDAKAHHETVGLQRVDAVVIDQSAGPGFHAQREAVFVGGTRAYRVTCTNAGDSEHVKVFEQVLRTFDFGGAQ